jgi:hypothetical protein
LFDGSLAAADDVCCRTCGVPIERRKKGVRGRQRKWCDDCRSPCGTPKRSRAGRKKDPCPKLVKKACLTCPATFEYVDRGQKRFYCDHCRKAGRRKNRPVATGYELICVQCQAPFVAKTPIAKCCSEKCKNHKKWADQPPRQYVCVECGNPFESKQNKASVCSDACLRARNSKISKAIAAEKFAPRPEHVCQGCRKAFVPCRKGGAQLKRGAAWGKFCSRACSRKAMPRPVGKQKSLPCGVCGENFVRNGKPNWRKADGRLVCSDRCAEIALVEKKARTQAAKPPPKQPTVRRCAECDEPFSTTRAKMKFCSTRCSKRLAQRIHRLKNKVDRRRREVKRKRLIRARTFDGAVDPLRVFERDRWRCQLCLRRTPRRLRGSYHHRAPELDHVISVAAGGDHSYANSQCSCRKCNLWKGDREVEPLSFIGRQILLGWRVLTFG